ncbi:MAG: hypothetical protein K9M45_05900 [Kiritimatiellales bacterium]|nr:hypothetical protein [Kiritimatiellales bacterium]
MMKRLAILLLVGVCAGCQRPGAPMGGRGGKISGADFVKRLDKDRDGRVSVDEFDGPAGDFTQFDANGDGFLTEDEAPSGPPPGAGRGGRR